MLGFLGLTDSTQPQEGRLGELRQNKNIGEQLQDLKGKVEKTMNKNKNELKNYRELTKFNENLTKSYVANLKIIVDISKLLSGYNEIFDLFKTKMAEIDQELGIPISSDDFDYMKRLTNEQMSQINDVFKKETGNLKRLYSKYGKQKEYDEVDVAEQLFDKTRVSGETTYSRLKTPLPMPSSILGGGAKKKKKQRKTKK